jgi:NAD(P)-dependent dehydrogenase (short-subunit alcohol dehydrogenase family)
MDLGIDGKVAVVTGGSRGIGKATAQKLAREGARVAITYQTRIDAANRTVGEIVAGGGVAVAVHLDLQSDHSIATAINAVLDQWHQVDILVNSASATDVDRAISGASSDWGARVRANVEGPYQAIERVVPSMREKRWGRIVNVSSILAIDGMPGFSWYTTAKAALHGMTRTIARELGPFGILCNVVMPGLTETEEQPVQLSQRHKQIVAASLSIRRLPTPDEVASLIVYLSSAANSAITGEAIRVNGG